MVCVLDKVPIFAFQPGSKRLHLGCGVDYREGWDNIDNREGLKVDCLHDVDKGFAGWPDDHYVEVYSNQVLEHLRNFALVHSEIYRICKYGALVVHEVPNGVGFNAISDPTHVQFYTEKTFRYLDPNWLVWAGLYKGYGGLLCHFQLEKHELREENLKVWLRVIKE